MIGTKDETKTCNKVDYEVTMADKIKPVGDGIPAKMMLIDDTVDEMEFGKKFCDVHTVTDTEKFEKIIADMLETYVQKHNDYGPSTTETFKMFGPTSFLVRIYDKFSRLKTLLYDNKGQAVKEESVIDTLKDLANYAILAIMDLSGN